MFVKPLSIEEILENNPEVNKEDIKKLKKWIEDQPHLPMPLDIHIICCLHRCFYDLEKSKIHMDNVLTAVSDTPEFTTVLTHDQYKFCSSVV